MKIHIVGGSGTGKTYLSTQIAKKLNICNYDLDNLFWDNSVNQYGTKMPQEKRDAMLKNILQQKDWIIEGVYYAWLSESFKEADKIIILDIPGRIYKIRIVRRFLRRKLGFEKSKKETFRSLFKLLQWTNKFQKENLPEIYKVISCYENKTITLHSKKEIDRYLSTVS